MIFYFLGLGIFIILVVISIIYFYKFRTVYSLLLFAVSIAAIIFAVGVNYLLFHRMGAP